MSNNNPITKLDELKKEADALGITYAPAIGESKLAEKITAKKAEVSTPEPDRITSLENKIGSLVSVVEGLVVLMGKTLEKTAAPDLAKLQSEIRVVDGNQRHQKLTKFS